MSQHVSPALSLWRIIAIATAAEAAFLGALMGAMGLCGAFNDWLDVVTQFAPIWLALALAGGAGGRLLMDPGPQRRAVTAVACVGVAIGAFFVLPDTVRHLADAGRAPPAHSVPLRVMSFNVWSDNPEPDVALRTIEAAHPDVVDLQEFDERFHVEDKALQSLYPYRVLCPAGVLSDVEIYSRLPPLGSGCMIADLAHRRGDPMHLVWLRVLAPDAKPVTVVTTHLVWPAPPGPQGREFLSLAATLRSLPAGEVVLTGDFNLTPWGYSMGRLERDLAPLTRRSHALFSWPTALKPGLPAPFPVLPIDQVFADPAWRVVKVRTLPRSSSDHYPVLVTLYR